MASANAGNNVGKGFVGDQFHRAVKTDVGVFASGTAARDGRRPAVCSSRMISGVGLGQTAG